MYLIDTSICIELTRRNVSVARRFKAYGADQLGLSVVCFGELLVGVQDFPEISTPWQDLGVILANTTLLTLTPTVAERYAAILYPLKRRGMMIGANDLWIAAHALALDLTLVTNNEREFSRIPDLRIENWTKPA